MLSARRGKSCGPLATKNGLTGGPESADYLPVLQGNTMAPPDQLPAGMFGWQEILPHIKPYQTSAAATLRAATSSFSLGEHSRPTKPR